MARKRGFLRRQHKECAERNKNAIATVRRLCVNAALRGVGLEDLRENVRRAWAEAGTPVSDADLQQNIVDGWTHGLASAINDHALSSDEKKWLNRYRRLYDITPSQLDAIGQGDHFQVFRMMALINAITEGDTIPRFDRAQRGWEFGRLSFNLMKSEALVWVFSNVGYMEQITRREFQGSSMGASFKVAKGVYVRPGMFRGRSVEKKSMEHTDTGDFGITTKHIYFAGSRKKFRVRLEKIVSFDPYSDALGIMRDNARAKPEAFMMDGNSPFFAINILDALLDKEDITLPKGDSPTLDDIVDDDGEDDGAGMFAAGTTM